MRAVCLTAVLSIATSANSALAADDTSALLKRQTQTLFDGVAGGDTKVWDRLTDADLAFTDENGVLMNKKEMLAQLTPLPRGVSGSIAITEWVAHTHGDVAVTTHLDDEQENFHGQKLHALYRATDTWLKEPDGWRVVAMQTIALNEDPPAVSLPTSTLDEYVGVYSAAPDYTYTIARDGNALVGGVTGRKAGPLKAELIDVLFVPGQPRSRKVIARDGAGRVTGYLGRREGRDVVWTRIK